MAEHIEVARAFVTIVPSLEGSQAEITKELTGATSEASEKAGSEGGSKFSEKFAGAIKGATAVIGAAVAGATAAAVATGKAFVSAANDVASFGNDIDKQSQKMQMSATGYQEWAFILEHTGTSIDGMKTAMKRLVTSAEEGADAFGALGISQEQLANMNPEETWNATITALQKVQDEGERTALASALLGKGAVELAPLFNTSAEAVEEMRQQVHDLGGIMSDDAVKASATYTDEMQNMKTALEGVKRNMISSFLPGISQVMKGLSLVFSGQGGIEEIRSGLTSVIQTITSMAPQFFSLAEVLVTSLLQGFAPMLPQLVSSIFSFLNQGILTVTGMVPQLLPAITAGVQGVMQALFECLPVIISATVDLIADLVTWLASDDNVKTFIDGLIALMTMLTEKFGDLLVVLLPAVVNIIGQIADSLTDPDNLGMLLQSTLYIVGAIAVALFNALPEIWNVIVKLFSNIGEMFVKFKDSALSKVKTWFSNVVQNVGTFAQNVLNKIKELPSKVIAIGKNLVEGLWNGISDKISWVKNKISGMGSQITNAIKRVFGIASPSKVWKKQVGAMLALGIGEGFADTMDDVKADMAAEASGLTTSMTTQVEAYGAQGAAMYDNAGSTYNGGNISINVYGAEGQSVSALADAVAYKLEEMTRRKELVWG